MKYWILTLVNILTLFSLSSQTTGVILGSCPNSTGASSHVERSAPDLSFRNPALPMEQRVDCILKQLTLDEKLAMMEHQNPAIARLGIPAYSWWNEALHGVEVKLDGLGINGCNNGAERPGLISFFPGEKDSHR